jgi:hypothetical protein
MLLDAAMFMGALPALIYAATAFTGQASISLAPGVRAAAPVTISVTRWATDDDRDALVAAVTNGGSAVACELLAMHEDVGTIQVGGLRTPIKYAHARPTLGGRLITLLTAEPILIVEGGVPDTKPRAGFDFGVVVLDLDAAGSGQGELASAATIRINGDKAVVTDDSGAAVVRLINVKSTQK